MSVHLRKVLTSVHMVALVSSSPREQCVNHVAQKVHIIARTASTGVMWKLLAHHALVVKVSTAFMPTMTAQTAVPTSVGTHPLAF